MLHKKKAAIIGFGGMGQRHYKAYQKIGVEVTAICDLDRNKIQELLPDFPERHIYDNYDDVLANEEVDILSVVTNGPTHAEVTIRASEAGVSNILCEKPIATNLNDAQQVVDICKRKRYQTCSQSHPALESHLHANKKDDSRRDNR